MTAASTTQAASVTRTILMAGLGGMPVGVLSPLKVLAIYSIAEVS